jgi:DNA-directed RNA polymerase subunit F
MADADIILDEVVEAGRLVSLAEVKSMLEKAEKDRDQLTYEQKIALEHARRFARTDVKAAKGIVKDLKAAFPAMEELFAFKIADLVPQHPDDVRSILQRSGLDLSDPDCEKVLEVVDKYYVA